MWDLQSATVGGVTKDAESPLFPYTMAFDGDRKFIQVAVLRFKMNSFRDGPTNEAEQVGCVINTRRTPHELLFLIASQRNTIPRETRRLVSYIYECKGDKLKLAYYDDLHCTDRPHGFAVADQPAGSPPLVVLEYTKAVPRQHDAGQPDDGRSGAEAGGAPARNRVRPPAAPKKP